MANRALRSPQFKLTISFGTAKSVKCTITINTVLRYTIVKQCEGATNVWFEIAELCRDYLNNELHTGSTPADPTIDIVTVLTSHAAANGSGSALNTVTFTDKGFDGYGTFKQGSSPIIVPSVPRWLIDFDPDFTGINDKYYVFIPTGYQGFIPLITASSSVEYFKFGSSDVDITGSSAGVKMNIVRINCTKYGAGNKVRFVNKYGVLQELWFFLKNTETITKEQKTYQRNLFNNLLNVPVYDNSGHSRTIFNLTAKQSFSLSSGYYPEWCNEWFEQLILSEQVWISDDTQTNPSLDVFIPVNVSTSSFTKKTTINDKLIEYTFTFDLAADYINNIR